MDYHEIKKHEKLSFSFQGSVSCVILMLLDMSSRTFWMFQEPTNHTITMQFYPSVLSAKSRGSLHLNTRFSKSIDMHDS